MSGGDTDASFGVLAADTGLHCRDPAMSVAPDRQRALAAPEQPGAPASLATGSEAAGAGASGDELGAEVGGGL